MGVPYIEDRIMFRPMGIGILMLLASTGCNQGRAENGVAPPVEKITPVTVHTVAAEDVQETFTLPGTLEAWEDLTLAAELAGAVRWIGASEGDRIRQGEVLVRIDPEAVEAELGRAEAEFELQEKNLERLRRLLAEKFVSQQEFDRGRQAFEAARAELRQARAAREKSALPSPVDGVLDRLLVDRGEYVAEGAPVAVLVQVDRLKVLVEVPEKDVPLLRAGQTVQVLPAAITGEAGGTRRGEILHLAYKADPSTRTYLAKVAIDNRDGSLRPGMITRVGFVRRSLKDVIAVPLYAMVERGGGRAVFVDEGGTARLRPVRIGPVVGERVIIEQGLAPGDRLLIEGQQLVADGTKIQVSGENQASGIRNQVSGKPES